MPRYQELARQIKATVPEAEVEGVVGRSTSFEVTVNGELIFSKLQIGSFPDFDEIVAQVEVAHQGGKPSQVEGTQGGSCKIL